jgi:DNA helicase II / ATP-dependent DNA helicase PcrA
VPITPAQTAQAEQHEWQAARDPADAIRLIAGPGTGKSATIERRVAHVLNNGSNASRVYVISFTRATCGELGIRISAFCAMQPCASVAAHIRTSTMHSLALRILRSANVLATLYPADPMVLDDWERSNVYDRELANALVCTPGRAAEVRLAHDAQWQTLNPQAIAQAAITNAERHGFDVFHTTRRNLYCCVLPGEVVYECVSRLQQAAIQPNQLPPIEHLIVDEYQDLNACDQEFIRRLARNGAMLFVAGDDDQSIYSFRHANPMGIVHFLATYPAATTHTLSACFRCTPAILGPASNLIAHNPNRLPKQLRSLYANAAPTVQGVLHVWSFASAQAERTAIANSCQQLINGPMAGQEDQIVILISNRRLQVGPITRELANLGLPFDPPGGEAIRDEPVIRGAYSILRIVRDQTTNAPDYVAHRTVLALLHGVGVGTSKAIGDLCAANNHNFHNLFYVAALPHWITGRSVAAVTRVRSIVQQIAGWTLQDSIGARTGDIAQLLSMFVFAGSSQIAEYLQEWNAFAASLPQGMTLEELLLFLAADDETGQRQILDAVRERLGESNEGAGVGQKRLRILTMHGAKGLSGKVVFIPSAEQGIMPSFRAIHAVGLLNEQRRLFYVSVTRAKAACIVSHAALHSGAEAFLIQQSPQVRLPRSQFLNEMGVPSRNRNGGLTAAETAQITADVNNL